MSASSSFVVRPTVHGNDAAKEPAGVHTITAPDARDSLARTRVPALRWYRHSGGAGERCR